MGTQREAWLLELPRLDVHEQAVYRLHAEAGVPRGREVVAVTPLDHGDPLSGRLLLGSALACVQP
jgi:hypothetical protein